MTDAPAAAGDAPDRGRWLILTLLLVATLLLVMDQTLTAVVLPQIAHDLAVGVEAASLSITVFILTAAVLLTVFGQLADIIGQQRQILLGLAVFAAGSLLTGSADAYHWLLAGRVVQGIAFALLAPAVLGLLNNTFPDGRARTLAFALWSTVSASGVAIGPLTGGLFASYLSWRYAFYINVPVCVALIVGVAVLLDNRPAADARMRFDMPGIALLGLTMIAIVIGFQEGDTLGWIAPAGSISIAGLSPVPFVVVAGLLCGCALVLVERRRARRDDAVVLIEPRIVATLSYRHALLCSGLMSMALYGLVVLLPIYMKFVLDAGSLAAGAALSLMGVGMIAGGLASHPIIERFGRRRVATASLAAQFALLLGALPLMSPDGSPLLVGALLLPYGFAYTTAFSALTNLLLRDIPKALSSRASGLSSTMRLGFDAFATAIIVGLMVGLTVGDTGTTIAAATGISDADRQTLERITHFRLGAGAGAAADETRFAAMAASPTLKPLIATLQAGFVDAGRGSLIAAAVFVLGALALSFRLPRDPAVRPAQRQEGMMKSDTVRNLYRLIDEGRFDAARAFLAPGFRHSSRFDASGIDADGWLSALQRIEPAFSDVDHGVVIIEETDDTVRGSFEVSGRHTGTLALPEAGIDPVAASGRRFRLPVEPFVAHFAGDLVVRLDVEHVDGGGVGGILAQLRKYKAG